MSQRVNFSRLITIMFAAKEQVLVTAGNKLTKVIHREAPSVVNVLAATSATESSRFVISLSQGPDLIGPRTVQR